MGLTFVLFSERPSYQNGLTYRFCMTWHGNCLQPQASLNYTLNGIPGGGDSAYERGRDTRRKF